jgi:glycosyltransferase involved in cell wall biosynthesis
MKAVHIIMLPQLEGFGSGHYLKGLCNAFTPEVEILIVSGAHTRGFQTFPVMSLDKPLSWPHWGDSPTQTMKWLSDFTEKLEAVITEHHPDIINVHHTGYPLLPAALCKRKFSIPLVLTVHGTCFMELEANATQHPESVAVGMLFQQLVSEADVVVALSESQREKIKDRYNHSNIVIINPGIASCFDRELTFSQRESYFFFAGRMAKCKGVLDLVELFERTDEKLFLAGPMQDIDPRIFSKPNITYLGNLTQEELAEHYCNAAATIIPSVWDEPFGLVATEALASGCPIITYNSGALSEIVDSTNGILCTNKDELREAIASIATKTVIFDRAQIASRARQKYSWKTASNQYLKIYKQLVKHATLSAIP